MSGWHHFRSGQVALANDLVERHFDQPGKEQKQTTEPGADHPRFQAQLSNIRTISSSWSSSLGAFFITSPRQRCEPLLPENLRDGHRRSLHSILLKRFADVIDREILLSKCDDEAANTFLLSRSRASLRHDEEVAIGIASKLMDQLPEAAERVAKLAGDFPSRPIIDTIGPECLVLPMGRVAGRKEDVRQVA